MKFNEKLIELRKKTGLSQEELAYKLNVTRQTISKWELGQTTPEMDKLSEISSFFGVNVDTLLSETEEVKIEDKKISNDEGKNKKIVLVIVGVLLLLTILGILIYGPIIRAFKTTFDTVTGTQKGAIKMIEKATAAAEQQIEEQQKEEKSEIYDQAVEQINQSTEQINSSERKYLTSVLEMYSGTKQSDTIKTAIDKIITNNKKHIDEKIIVQYQGQSITEPAELQNLKYNFDKGTDYEISYEYDEKGYIYQMDILNLN